MVQPAYSNCLFEKEDCPFENEIASSGKLNKVLITGLAQNQRNVLPNAAARPGGCWGWRARDLESRKLAGRYARWCEYPG